MTDAPALFAKHQDLAINMARDWYLPGSDEDDVRQEARIALWEAARSWDPTRMRSFRAFARGCIRARLASKVRDARRLKHMVLTHADRDLPVDDNGDQMSLLDTVASPCHAEDMAMYRETIAEVSCCLSPLERQAIARVMLGFGCADTVMCNALNRARRKIRQEAA